MITGKEIVASINTKGMNEYALDALEEKIDNELKKAYQQGVEDGQTSIIKTQMFMGVT
jgi:hypothetical protein